MSRTQARSFQVLFIDDDPAYLRALVRNFADPVILTVVPDPDAAFDALTADHFDIVLLGLVLSQDQLVTVLHRFRDAFPECPIVVVSNSAEQEVAILALRAGADDYLASDGLSHILLERVIRYALERSRAARDLRASELKFAKAFMANPSAMAIVSQRDSVVIDTNRSFERLFGFVQAEVVGQPVESLSIWREAGVRQRILTAVRGGRAVSEIEVELNDSGGKAVSVLMSSEVVGLDSGPHSLILLHDISERKSVEAELAGTAARLQSLLDNAGDGISVLTVDGVILEANRSMGDILGRDPAEIIGRHIEAFGMPDATAEQLRQFGAIVAKGAGHVSGTRLRRADGTTVIVDFSITRIRLDAQDLIITIGRDVTVRHALEEQFRQVQKMEAIGQLAGGVAHDFNNVLTTIFGYAQLATELAPDDGAAQEDLEEIRRAAERAATLTHQLLAFSRKQVLEPAVMSVNEGMRDIEKMLRRLVGGQVEFELALSGEAGNILIDPGQFQQVVMNLAINARDAMPGGGTLRLETARADVGEPQSGPFEGLAPGKYVVVTVRDTGEGIGPDTIARIFDPFFTTKAKGKGTGLGLSTVQGIVQQAGGQIAVASRLGEGTTFRICFPRVEAPVRPVVSVRSPSALTGTETLLLAEDDAAIRTLLRLSLERLGYTVLASGSALAALALARSQVGPIDLLITDVVMPGGGGGQLAKDLEVLRPDAKVLYMSGYADDAIVHHGVLQSGRSFLQKPFTPADLARKVRELLSGSEADAY